VKSKKKSISNMMAIGNLSVAVIATKSDAEFRSIQTRNWTVSKTENNIGNEFTSGE
jgi:hypothetical protein